MSHISASTLILSCLLLFGCSESSDLDASNTAVAEASSDGTVVTRDATSKELDDLKKIQAVWSKINKQFPGPEEPTNAPIYKASSVIAPGIVELTDGRQYQIDGISCDENGSILISGHVMSSDPLVAFIPTSSLHEKPLRADIWAVSYIVIDGKTTPTFSSLAETALMNGWCALNKLPHNKYSSRYSALLNDYPKSGL